MLNREACVGLLLVVFASACSSTPKTSKEAISQAEAEAFLAKYCSKLDEKTTLDQELYGDIVVRSSTKEFKGQYPASIHFAKDKSFSLEVTNLIGGTMAILKGDFSTVEVFSPGRPKYNRKGIKQYMGLTVPLFAKMLHGDLPCPEKPVAQVSGNEILIKDGPLDWKIERSDLDSGSVPLRVRIFEKDRVMVEMLIESWSADQYAEKVKIRTAEGDLKWSWRSRDLK